MTAETVAELRSASVARARLAQDVDSTGYGRGQQRCGMGIANQRFEQGMGEDWICNPGLGVIGFDQGMWEHRRTRLQREQP